VLPVRRIVTLNDESGKSFVSLDGDAPNATGHVTNIWTAGTVGKAQGSSFDAGAAYTGFLPNAGEVLIRYFTVQPESEVSHLSIEQQRAAAHAYFGQYDVQPDTSKHPRMHLTKTIDYIVVLSGFITMILDREEVDLKPLDVVIQQGTNHAWSNRSKEPALCMAVLIDRSS
jgi:uncharacterized cupin superfamily protein